MRTLIALALCCLSPDRLSAQSAESPGRRSAARPDGRRGPNRGARAADPGTGPAYSRARTSPGQRDAEPAEPAEPPAAAAERGTVRRSRRPGPSPATWTSTSTSPEEDDPQLDFHRFVLLFNHSFSDRLRFIGELELEHALRRRSRRVGRAGARTGVPGLQGQAGVQPARGHAAGAGRDHQRAARAAVLLRRRAAVRRHRSSSRRPGSMPAPAFTAPSARAGSTAPT